MPQGPDGKTIIIVKKVSGHGGHHGGAWKVAYADFVTAMMALFMVLWLVNSASTVTRERIASYFKRPGVFEQGSGTPLETGGGGILADTFAPPADANSQILPSKQIYDVDTEGGPKVEGFKGGEKNTDDSGDDKAIEHKAAPLSPEAQAEAKAEALNEKAEIEALASELQQSVEKGKDQVAKALGKVDIKVDQRGLHIEIMDTPTASMFRLGSATIMPEAEAEMKKISDMLKQLPNPIDIEGHTDARPYHSASIFAYDNWDLSTDRANAARRALKVAGVQDSQIARVVGYAAQRLKFPETPLADSNRRISISMRYTEQAAEILQGTQVVETTSKPIGQPQVIAPPPVVVVPAKPGVTGIALPTGELPSSANIGGETSTPLSSSTTPGGLHVEVGTTMPEGAVITPTDNADQPSSRPAWMEKDKIFGNTNPFFTK